jgi:RNA recognition motif-containing protein
LTSEEYIVIVAFVEFEDPRDADDAVRALDGT